MFLSPCLSGFRRLRAVHCCFDLFVSFPFCRCCRIWTLSFTVFDCSCPVDLCAAVPPASFLATAAGVPQGSPPSERIRFRQVRVRLRRWCPRGGLPRQRRDTAGRRRPCCPRPCTGPSAAAPPGRGAPRSAAHTHMGGACRGGGARPGGAEVVGACAAL